MFDFLEISLEAATWVMLFVMSLCGIFFLYMVVSAIVEEIRFKQAEKKLVEALEKEGSVE